MTVTDAAAAVGVNKSTVSRYVSGGLVTDYGTPGKPRVSVAEVRAARDGALDPAKRRTQPVPSTSMASTEATLANERIRKTRADADRAELDNAKAQGQLCDRQAVEDSGFELGVSLRNLLAGRVPALAQAVAGQTDFRAVSLAIDTADRKLLAAFEARVREALADAGVVTAPVVTDAPAP